MTKKEEDKGEKLEFITREEAERMARDIKGVGEEMKKFRESSDERLENIELSMKSKSDTKGDIWESIKSRINNIEGLMNEMVDRLPKKKERIHVKSNAEIEEDARKLLEDMLNDAI